MHLNYLSVGFGDLRFGHHAEFTRPFLCERPGVGLMGLCKICSPIPVRRSTGSQ
jgi:hypothetical protein